MRVVLIITLFAACLCCHAQSEREFVVKKNIVIPLDSLLKIWIMPGEDTLSSGGVYSFKIIPEMDNYFDKFDCTSCGMGRENGRVYFQVFGDHQKGYDVLMKFYRTIDGKPILVGHRFFIAAPSGLLPRPPK